MYQYPSAETAKRRRQKRTVVCLSANRVVPPDANPALSLTPKVKWGRIMTATPTP